MIVPNLPLIIIALPYSKYNAQFTHFLNTQPVNKIHTIELLSHYVKQQFNLQALAKRSNIVCQTVEICLTTRLFYRWATSQNCKIFLLEPSKNVSNFFVNIAKRMLLLYAFQAMFCDAAAQFRMFDKQCLIFWPWPYREKLNDDGEMEYARPLL